MKPNDQEIENVLRGAPKPKAPANLKSQLAAQIRLGGTGTRPQPTAFSSSFGGWLRRWWPALAPATASLACAAMMVSQELEIRGLQQIKFRLAEQRASLRIAAPSAAAVPAQPEAGASDVATAEQEEIARLKERAGQLGSEVARLEKLQAENEALRKQPAAPAGLTEAELTALAKAREKALSIQCINNLKQIGLSVRQWQLDNSDVSPPNFLSMSNELGAPKVLVCAADTNRVVAPSFANYTDSNSSYEYLTPSAKNSETEPHRVLTRCPIHGHIGMCDGSVQGYAWKRQPEYFVERDRKLYYEPPSSNPDR